MNWIREYNTIIELIENNPIDITYIELEQAVLYKVPYFKKMFFELTGISFYDYFISRKMYYCALAIAKGDKPSDVSIRCGYKSYEGFRTAFTKHQGYSPNSIKADPALIKHSPPIRVTLSVTGGEKVSFRVIEVDEPISLYVREYTCPLSESRNVLPGLFVQNKKREEAEGKWVSKYAVSYEKNDKIHFLIGRLKDGEPTPDEQEQLLAYDKYAVFDFHGTYEDSVSYRNRIFSDWLISETRYIPISYILFEKIEEENNGTFHISTGIPVRDSLEETQDDV